MPNIRPPYEFSQAIDKTARELRKLDCFEYLPFAQELEAIQYFCGFCYEPFFSDRTDREKLKDKLYSGILERAGISDKDSAEKFLDNYARNIKPRMVEAAEAYWLLLEAQKKEIEAFRDGISSGFGASGVPYRSQPKTPAAASGRIFSMAALYSGSAYVLIYGDKDSTDFNVAVLPGTDVYDALELAAAIAGISYSAYYTNKYLSTSPEDLMDRLVREDGQFIRLIPASDVRVVN